MLSPNPAPGLEIEGSLLTAPAADWFPKLVGYYPVEASPVELPNRLPGCADGAGAELLPNRPPFGGDDAGTEVFPNRFPVALFESPSAGCGFPKRFARY